jgi:prepilin-type N-terminal cleavage/methylation domain-containing protein
MKFPAAINTRQKGFTLVEIIITLIATGILGAIFINLMGTALNDSWSTVEMVRDEAAAVRIMEEIIADYVYLMNTNPGGALAQIKSDGDGGTYGTAVIMQWVDFDSSGDLVGPVAPGNTLLVTVQASGKDIINILTNSRAVNHPPIRY